MLTKKEIYLDFDGTVVEHAYPEIGKANPHAKVVINKLFMLDYRIILNTMRTEFCDKSLQAALDYLKERLKIDIQYFTTKKIYPQPWRIEELRNANAIFIDDIADGIPTIPTTAHGDMVDWKAIEKQLTKAAVLY